MFLLEKGEKDLRTCIGKNSLKKVAPKEVTVDEAVMYI
jgi:hypothetical protein